MSADNQDTKPEEQIPLTENQPAESEPAAPVEEPPKTKKNWFTWGKKKATADETNVEEGANKEEDEPEKKEKRCWWKKCAKGEGEQKEDNIAIGIDLVNRDTNAINSHVQLAFDDIFGEPDSQHSWDFAWRLNHTLFTHTRQFVYRLVSLIALPFTILFAVLFAIVTAANVFLVVPLGKLLSIPGNLLAKVWNWLVHAVFDPLASAIGLVFSSFTIRKYGINQETTAPCV
uniref:Caveolin n=1 Tax=Caenorhabditis japonica TaxID=281687 RepID=A0A8R1DFR3_CAEJA